MSDANTTASANDKLGSPSSNMPRWARDLGEETWEWILELLYDGWNVADVAREVVLPPNKLRSLQLYARKFGPRRRLILFAKFKDALANGAAEWGDDMAKSLKLIAAYACSDQIAPSKQLKAADLMVRATEALSKLMKGDEAADKQRERDEASTAPVDRDEVVRRVKAVYGITD